MRDNTSSVSGVIMTSSDHKEALADFSLEYLQALMMWNNVEAGLKDLLWHLLGSGSAARCIVSDMGNRSLLEGLEAASRELDDKMIKSHINHLCAGFGILLGHRNLYVHGIIGFSNDNEQTSGLLWRMKGEGRLRLSVNSLKRDRLSAYSAHVDAMWKYAAAIQVSVGMRELRTVGVGLTGDKPPSLDKPVWPASVQNTPHYLQE